MFWYNYHFFIANKYLLKFNTFFLISVLTSDMRMYITESNCKFTRLASRFPSINNFALVFNNLSLTLRGKIIIWSGPMRSVMSDNSRAVAARTIAFWWLKNRNHNIEISFVARKKRFSISRKLRTYLAPRSTMIPMVLWGGRYCTI